MSIVRNEDSIYVEYAMPEDIKTLITDDFLKEFRNQLFRIYNYSLETFADANNSIPMSTSTSGWFAAFGKACLLTHKEKLLDYWRTLPWYDSDIFDGELTEMLIERGFILGDLNKVIEEQLNIKQGDLRVCNDCERLYSKDMVININHGLNSRYRCLYCQDIKETKTGNKNATDYYRRILKELDEYKNKHPLDNDD